MTLFFNIVQNIGVDRTTHRFSQCGGLGIVYGWEYISPVVLRLPKIRITIGTNMMTTMMERMEY
jgi:hypothetical protein